MRAKLKQRTWLHLVLALVIVVGGFVAVRALRGDDAAAGAGEAQTATAEIGTVTETVTASGQVESASTADVSFSGTAASSTVTEIAVEVGQQVQAGQVLARVNSTTAEIALESAEADLEAAEEALEDAEDGSASADAAPGSAASTGSTQTVAQAEVAVRQAEVEVLEAAADLNGTTLTAPIAGTVTAINGSVGEVASATASSSTGGSATSGGTGATPGGAGTNENGSGSTSSTPFIVLDDMTKLAVRVSVAEADAQGVAVGQKATVTLNAQSDETFTATVTSIDPNATTSNNVVSYPVVLTFDESPANVKLGATANVSITVAEAADVVSIPSTAVSTVGGRETVTVVDGDDERQVEVTIGVRGDSLVEVTDGLQEGDEVVLPETTGGAAGGGVPELPAGGFPGGGNVFPIGGGFPGGGG